MADRLGITKGRISQIRSTAPGPERAMSSESAEVTKTGWERWRGLGLGPDRAISGLPHRDTVRVRS
ncbi:hypothetical protein [Nocardia tengchongensis]|uniref:hypothetical protein n=1 Tax=Nocardia tengchongensis TaxID=2055889 RepID=UPI003D161697